MSLSQNTASKIGTGPALTFATLGTSVGLSAFRNPSKTASTYGLPLTPGTEPTPFIRAFAARNIGSGLGIIALLLCGQRRSVAVVLATGTVVMALDGWIVARARGAWTAEAMGHLGFVPVAFLTGWLLVM